MAFQYIDESDLFSAINDAKKYMRPLFEPFQEFERIARNRPHPGIDRAYPKVTDGTTASVIQKTPRRIIQQLPSGTVTSPANDWLTIVAEFILTDKILPNANGQYAFIQKVWNAVSKALTYGAQPAYISFVKRGKYIGTDMTLPYVKDVFLEPGKLSDRDSNYIIMRSWYQPRDIKAIIANQNKLKEKADERGDEFDYGGWDLKVLAEIQDSMSQKDDLTTTPSERDKNNRSGGIEIYHVFQRGKKSQFYSFHMASQQVVRRRINKDPTGNIPIHFLYSDTDGSNPLGRGFVELVGAMQNLMDAEVQMYQYNRALMLNPPMVKRGSWNKNQAKLAPNVLVDLGSDPNAIWDTVKIDSSAIANFPNNYGLMKSQLLNLLSSPDTSISADVGNPGFSKTDAGVKTRQQTLNVDDNYIRRQTESWLQQVYTTMLNLYFAERTDVDTLQLDQDTAAEIAEIDPSLVNDKNQIRIDYANETEALDYMVDAGTSEVQENSDEIDKLKEVLADVNQNPYSIQYVQQAGKELNLGEVYRQLFEKLGLKNMDKILTDIPKGPDGQTQPTTPPMAMDKPKLVINYDDVTSPSVKAQLLNNAGIHADPNDIAQWDQNKLQAENQDNGTLQAVEHPIIKLMTSLNIKFTDLPEDSKQEVLQIIGIPSQQMSPTQQNIALQANQQSHDILQGQEQQNNQQQQMNHQAQQNQAQNLLQANSQMQQNEQHAQQLAAMGVPSNKIQQALAMLDHGIQPNEVMNMIGAK